MALLHKKAQIFSLDIFIALGIFIFIMLSVTLVWIVTKDRFTTQESKNDMHMIAQQAIATLVETPGRPSDWYLKPNSTFPRTPPVPNDYFNNAYGEKNISSLGLTKTIPNILERDKIRKLIEINKTNYTFLKQALGIQGPAYEFYMEFDEFNGTAYTKRYELGLNKTISNILVQDVIIQQRMALIDNWTIVRLELWRFTNNTR